MINNINTGKRTANHDASNSCLTWQAIIQLALGLLLITATAFVYSLIPHPAVLIPSLMGAALLFLGAKAFLVCRSIVLHDHHHPTTG